MRSFGRVGAGWWAAPSPALAHKLRGGGRIRSRSGWRRREGARPLRARKPRPPPPKLLGEVGVGWIVDRRRASDCARWRPPSRPSPTNCVGEGERQESRRSGIEFSPSPATAGEGAGGRGLRRAPVRSMPTSLDPGGTAGPAGHEGASVRDRTLPSPRGTSGEGPGEGPCVGCSSMPFVEPRTAGVPPPAVLGEVARRRAGGGAGLAPWAGGFGYKRVRPRGDESPRGRWYCNSDRFGQNTLPSRSPRHTASSSASSRTSTTSSTGAGTFCE